MELSEVRIVTDEGYDWFVCGVIGGAEDQTGCPVGPLGRRYWRPHCRDGRGLIILNRRWKKVHVFVMRGAPGSGKSTLAEALFHAYAKVGQDGKMDGTIVSADEYFTRRGPNEAITGYFHDQNLEAEAHNTCVRSYHDAVTRSLDCIIVDNTNSRLIEAAYYFAWGMALGYTVVLYTVHAPLEVCLERNVHGVPKEVVESMWNRIEKEEGEKPPPWWMTDYADQDFVEMFYSEVMGMKPGGLSASERGE